MVGRSRHQIAHRVGLAGPRRAVQQESAFDVLAARTQTLSRSGNPKDVAFDRVDHPLRQDELLRGHVRARIEDEHR
jgi:hypothetical protein